MDNHGTNTFTGSSTASRSITDGKDEDGNPTGNAITQPESTISVVSYKYLCSALSSLDNGLHCTKCLDIFDDNLLQCERCVIWYCAKCVGLVAEHFEFMKCQLCGGGVVVSTPSRA